MLRARQISYCTWTQGRGLCSTDQAHCVAEDVLLDVDRFEEGHHRQHDGKTYIITRTLHRYGLHAFESCGVIWSPSEHGVNNLLST